MEDMHTSTDSASFLRCGHAMHTKCLNSYMKTNVKCPLCKKSICDPKLFEKTQDAYFEGTRMPEEYKDAKMIILCNDCIHESTIPFHIDGGKCTSCSSYNTTIVASHMNKKSEEQGLNQDDKSKEKDMDEDNYSDGYADIDQ